jgi:hypothetical protein
MVFSEPGAGLRPYEIPFDVAPGTTICVEANRDGVWSSLPGCVSTAEVNLSNASASTATGTVRVPTFTGPITMRATVNGVPQTSSYSSAGEGARPFTVSYTATIGQTVCVEANAYGFWTRSQPCQTVSGPPNGAVDFASAQTLSGSSIQVSWTSTTTNESGFLVYRYNGSTQTLLTACPTSTPDLTSCVDTGLVPGELYWYQVYAWNSSGIVGAPGLAVARTLPATPTAPVVTGAIATGPNSFRVHWIDNSNNETAFRVYRWTGATTELMGSVASGTSLDVNSASVSSSTLQVFLVAAVNASGETLSDSYVYSAPWVAPDPRAPLLTTITNATSTGLTVNWTDQSTTETGFVVYRFTPGSASGSIVNCPTSVPNLTSCTDSGLTPGNFYFYYVYALIPGQTAVAGNPLVFRAPKPLGAPTMSSIVSVRPDRLRVEWIDNATDETGYVIYEYANSVFTPVATVGPNVTSKEIVGLPAGSFRVYVVAAQRGAELRYAPQAIWGIAP